MTDCFATCPFHTTRDTEACPNFWTCANHFVEITMPCTCNCGKPVNCEDEECYACMCKGVAHSKEDRENVPRYLYDDEYGTYKPPVSANE